MKLIDVKTSTYNDFNGQSNIKDFKFKVGDHVRISKYKSIFAKDCKRNWPEDIFFIEKLKILYRGDVISDPNGKEIDKTFYEQELQKINVKDIKVIQKKVMDCKLMIY